MIPALFRGSLWLAALAAGAAVLAPTGFAAWLGALAGAFALLAWWLWRSEQARRATRPDTGVDPLPDAPRIDRAALDDVAARIRQLASSANSFDAALHDAARILKSELGALDARVYRVRIAAEDAQAMPRITELIATRSGFHPAGEMSAYEMSAIHGSALVLAIRRQRAVLALPDVVALPIACGGTVVAALALGDIALAGDDDALQALLAASADTLAGIAERGASGPMTAHARAGESIAADDSQFPGSDLDGSPLPDSLPDSSLNQSLNQSSHPLRPGPSPTMLIRRPPLDLPVADPVGPATGSQPSPAVAPAVLDAAALARLTELDPGGTSRLLPRVLTAYLNSVARLHPPFAAARPLHDFEAIRHVAHTLKSSSASIGALKLSAMCAEIDTMIRTADTAGIDPHLDSMDAELERVLKAVKHLLGGHP